MSPKTSSEIFKFAGQYTLTFSPAWTSCRLLYHFILGTQACLLHYHILLCGVMRLGWLLVGHWLLLTIVSKTLSQTFRAKAFEAIASESFVPGFLTHWQPACTGDFLLICFVALIAHSPASVELHSSLVIPQTRFDDITF